MKNSLVTPEMRQIRWRYRWTVIVAMSAYVLIIAAISGWLGGGWLLSMTGWKAYVAAVTPVLPIAVVIYAAARYLATEPDEFYRMIQVQASGLAGGLTMIACTAWGFLAVYAHVWEHHVIMLVFPMNCLFFGLVSPFVHWRYR